MLSARNLFREPRSSKKFRNTCFARCSAVYFRPSALTAVKLCLILACTLFLYRAKDVITVSQKISS